MTDIILSPEELAEIERKVAAFRAVVTRAAIRRHELRPVSAAQTAKREARKALEDPATQVAIMERLLAGEQYKELAAEYRHAATFLSHHIQNVVLDQMHYDRNDNDCEWYRCLMARRADYLATWLPLGLARLRAKLPPPTATARTAAPPP